MQSPYRYVCSLRPGDFCTVMVMDVNEHDGTFGVMRWPLLINAVDEAVNRALLVPRKPLGTVAVGKPCLALYLDKRHYRAVIHSLRQDGTCLVYFVDYGNLWTTSFANLFQIEDFLLNNIPVFLNRCRLFEIAQDKLIMLHIKELTNYPENIMCCSVESIDDHDICNVKLFKYSQNDYTDLDQFFRGRNMVINLCLEETKGSLTELNTYQDDTDNFVDNQEALRDLAVRVMFSDNFTIDEDIKLVKVAICKIISSIEFYVIPVIEKTEEYYKNLFDKIKSCSTLMNMNKLKSNLSMFGYYNEQKSQWRRGRVVDYTDVVGLTELKIVDVDSHKEVVLQIQSNQPITNMKTLNEDLIKVKPQSLRCIIPNFNPKSGADNVLENYVKSYEGKLYILPLHMEQNPHQEEVFYVNLYRAKTIPTEMIEGKSRLISYGMECLTYSVSESFPLRCDLLIDIYRDSLNGLDERSIQVLQTYLRPITPNQARFRGTITSIQRDSNSEHVILHFRYGKNQSHYKTIQQTIASLVKKGCLERYRRKISKYHRCLVRDVPTDSWQRAKILDIQFDQAFHLNKINLCLVDIGGSSLYFIEDIYDHVVAPEMPSLANSAVLDSVDINHHLSGCKINLSSLIGSKADFHWVNFPHLPMKISLNNFQI